MRFMSHIWVLLIKQDSLRITTISRNNFLYLRFFETTFFQRKALIILLNITLIRQDNSILNKSTILRPLYTIHILAIFLIS